MWVEDAPSSCPCFSLRHPRNGGFLRFLRTGWGTWIPSRQNYPVQSAAYEVRGQECDTFRLIEQATLDTRDRSFATVAEMHLCGSTALRRRQIGRASCRERVCRYG